jgi:hypothetical protein
MYQIDFENCIFHDATIEKINYESDLVTLYIHNALYENSYCDLSIELKSEEYGLQIYSLKQYPRCRKVKLKGREISIHTLKSFSERGYTPKINEFLVSAESNLVIIDSVLFPYARKRGVYKKIIISIDYESEFVIKKLS